MDHHVVVIHTHGDYNKGDIVTDSKQVEALLRDHPQNVNRITPKPKPKG